MKNSLRVLITRPEHQSERLALALENFGAEVLKFPTLNIIPLKDTTNIVEIGKSINKYDILIFISANAVLNALSYWDVSIIRSTIIAMGSATKQALEKAGIEHCVMPEPPFTSESLLRIPELQQIQGKNVLLVTGEGGRPFLETELNERGASVTRLVVYARQCPESSPALLENFWAGDICRIIICTSFESVENLIALTPIHLHSHLKNTPLLVVSPRIEELVSSKNKFKQIVVSENASDEAILAKIRSWYDVHI